MEKVHSNPQPPRRTIKCVWRLSFVTSAILGFASSYTLAQEAVEKISEAEIKTVLDPSPFLSARAAGLGGAMSTLSDGSEAVYYNPAGIGGLHGTNKKQKSFRGLHFPYLGASANENAKNLKSEFSALGGTEDRNVGQSIIDASEGKRQFGRASALFDLTIKRSIYIGYSDVQFAAVKASDVPSTKADGTDAAGKISVKYRSLSGSGVGFSVVDAKKRFYFGSFTGYNKIALTSADGLSYSDVINADTRKTLLKDSSSKWKGASTNVGILWVFSKIWRPSLAIVARDVGGTTYKSVGDVPAGAVDSLLVQQDLTAGFSVSPKFGKNSSFNFILEGHDLTDPNKTLRKKVRIGMELSFGGFGSNSNFGLRGGYNSAGASYGLNINIGLIQIEAASESVDIGINNKKLIEQRKVAIFSVNLAND